MIAAGLALAAYLALAVVALRRPLLFRIAYRQLARRKSQSVLMAVGMMFATAGIMAMATTGDVLVAVIQSMVLDSAGRTDVLLSAGGKPFDPSIAGRLAADSAVARDFPFLQPTLELTGSAADEDRRLSVPSAQLAGLGRAPGAGFGPFILAGGGRLDTGDLTGTRSVLTKKLADRLAARPGDRLRVLVSGPGGEATELETTVAGVAVTSSDAAQSIQADVFLPLPLLQQAVGAPVVNLVRVGAPGGGLAEVAAAHRAAPALRQALDSAPGGQALQVLEVKREALTALAGSGSGFDWVRTVILGLSSVIVLAAVTVVIILSLALAEERRTSLALLRALGLSRTGIVLVAALEASGYALAGTLLGVGPGLAYAYFELQKLVSQHPFHADLTVQPGSVLLALGGGLLVTLATVVVASFQTSRMTISSAIKALPEPRRPARLTWFRRAWMTLVGAAGAVLLFLPSATVRELGGAVLIVGLVAAVRGRIGERQRATLAGAALAAWVAGVGAAAETGLVKLPGQESVWLPTLAGVIGVAAGALLLAANLALLERLIELASSRAGAALRPPLAYLTRRPLRTALATGTIAMVIAGLTSFGSLASTFTAGEAQASQGWDVVVTSAGDAALRLPAGANSLVAAQYPIATAAYAGEGKHSSTTQDSYDWQYMTVTLYVLSDPQFASPPVHLSYHDPRFPDERAAWQAVRDTPGLAIMPSGEAGDVTELDRANPIQLRLAGTSNSLVFGSQFGSWVIVSQRTLAEIEASGRGSLILARTRPGISPAALAEEVRRDAYGQGVDAVTTASLVAGEARGVLGLLDFFSDLLDVGLFIGVLSLGVLSFRAAIERRRVIGILRALGYQPGQVLIALLLESLLAALIGVTLGVGVGAFAGYVTALNAPNTFGFDWGRALWPAILVCLAVLATAVAPAVRASRIPAADAIRFVE